MTERARTRSDAFLAGIRTGSLPALGPEPRPDRLAVDVVTATVEDFCREHRCQGSLEGMLRAAALLWHDHLDDSHTLSQNIPGPDGSFLHGIMHRREPDYGNAAYWFRRVGDHPCFGGIAAGATDLLTRVKRKDLLDRLAPSGAWQPFAFIDSCNRALRGGLDHDVQPLQEIQRIEFEAFVRSVLA